MPPKKANKSPELTDRTTRSKAGTSKSKPKYTYSDQESEGEEEFNPNIDLTSTGNLPRLPAHLIRPVPRRSYSPTEFDSPPRGDKTTNRTLFHSVNMSDHEEEERAQEAARAAQRQPVIPPGVSPDMVMLMTMFQNQMADSERRAERARREQAEQQAQAMRLLVDQMASISKSRPEKPKAPNSRVPNFDIDTDQKSFPQWKEKWDAYIIGNRLHTIENDEERNERILCDLKGALTINTLKWFKHRDLTQNE